VIGLQALRGDIPNASGYRYTLAATGGHQGGPAAWFFDLATSYPSFAIQLGFAFPVGNNVSTTIQLPASLSNTQLTVQVATIGNPFQIFMSHAVLMPLNFQ
jgi:hypothetical protein